MTYKLLFTWMMKSLISLRKLTNNKFTLYVYVLVKTHKELSEFIKDDFIF